MTPQMSINKNKEAVRTAQLEENKIFTDYTINKKNNYINISDNEKEENEAFDLASKALLIMHSVLTDYNMGEGDNYINVSVNNSIAENAPEALSVMQRSDEPRPNGLPGSTPGWGAPSALSVIQKQSFEGGLY